MKEISIKKYIIQLFIVAVLLFVFNKMYLRPWVIDQGFSGLLLIIVYSLPNLVEAVMGTLVVTGILLQLKFSFGRFFKRVKDLTIYLMAAMFTAVYVISQELTFHNIGGNNVYDFNDVVASILGLISTFLILVIFGFEEKKES